MPTHGLSDDLLKALLDRSRAAALAWWEDGTIAYWNLGAQALYGYTSDGAVGREHPALLSTEYPDGLTFERLCATLRDVGYWEGDIRQRAAGGSPVVVRARMTAVQRDGQMLVLEMHQDLPADLDRREREQAGSQVQRLLDTLDAAQVGAFDWNLAAGKITWTPWHERLWGQEPGTFGGTFADFARAVHPEDLDELNRLIALSRDTGAGYAHEFRVRWPDGTTHWILGRGRFYYDAAGTPTSMLGIVIDATERKRAEQALRESEAALRALSDRLRTVREDESTRIARELHDELGQALTALKIDLIWLDRRLSNRQLPDDSQPLRDRIRQMVSHIDITVQAVRRMASDLRPGLLDDLGLTAAIEWQVQEFQKRTGVSAAVYLPPEELLTEPDAATAAYRILLEALTNVARHAQASHVDVRLTAAHDVLQLDVVDDGVGFETRVVHDRRSLGLMGMRERATALGGTVEFSPVAPHGTRVRVTLPRAGQAASELSPS